MTSCCGRTTRALGDGPFIDRQARRAHLDRIVEWLRKRDDEQRRRDLRSQIDEHLVAGRPVPPDLRDEEAALTAKLKK